MASDIAGWVGTVFRNVAPTDHTVTRVHVNRGGPFGPGEGDPQEAGEAVLNLPGLLGALGTGILPYGTCPRITWKIKGEEKRGRGRTHTCYCKWSGYLNNGGSWTTGTNLMTNVTALATTLSAGTDVTHGIIAHHLSLRVHSRADATTRDVTGYVVRLQPSYLRSRLTAP
jgi:hypothetical protein